MGAGAPMPKLLRSEIFCPVPCVDGSKLATTDERRALRDARRTSSARTFSSARDRDDRCGGQLPALRPPHPIPLALIRSQSSRSCERTETHSIRLGISS
jgi:hypothetical protein